MFSKTDLSQLAERGISEAKAKVQMQCFKTGFPALNIVAASALGKGIMKPSAAEEEGYLNDWAAYLEGDHTILKFVPASGAASRMFKDLFEYLETGKETPFVEKFLGNLEYFAFYPELIHRAGVDAEGLEVVDTLLNKMHYGQLPKGLLLFHSYPDGARTPALEHMVEGALYAKNAKNEVNLHFTVSHEHLALFEEHIKGHVRTYEDKFGVKYTISFSEQKPSTDTLAADKKGQPFRTKEGKLLFRPGGHGALIENLGEQEADIVFIKNIDNVVPDRLKEPTVRYKRLLAGILVNKQAKAFRYLRDLDRGMANLKEIKAFLNDELSVQLAKYDSENMRAVLNRPMRVCGMVKNEGEPGGGPFLVKDADGRVQNQILESSQIEDKKLMAKATHFNPVDLVCGIRDYQGNRFDLPKFVDPKTGFISQKSKDGKELQALELPGLWNGAMANWNTIFVEVPIETFNPVKTVNDLLREQHQ
ncbi:MAG: DUF4301 family protein [Paludibacteraceae bacterium]|nr:DUF4301 family protein [Paludibacteraceae bacterium]